MTYPADATDHRALRLLAILQPKLPKSILSDNYRTDLFENYLHQIFPVDPVVEPDAGIRAKNQNVQDAVNLNHSDTDITINDGSLSFWAGQVFDYFLTDNEGTWNGNQTFVTGNTNLQDKLVDETAMDNAEKLQLSQDLGLYTFLNLVNQSVWASNPPTVTNGNNYRSLVFELNAYVIDMINQMDDLVLDEYLAEFGGSCSATDDVPDQPNSPTIANVTHDVVTILIGASICAHNDPIDHYKVFRRLNGQGSFVEIAQHTNLVDLNFMDSTVLPNTAYEYHTKAHNAIGDSVASTNVDAITLQLPADGEDPPENLLDFLDDIVSEISDLLNGIFLGLTELSADKLFEMKILEVLMSSTADGSINDKVTTATNALELQKQLKILSASAVADDIGE